MSDQFAEGTLKLLLNGLHPEADAVRTEVRKRNTVRRLPVAAAVERVIVGVHSDFDSLVGLEVPRVVKVHVFPVGSPPVTSSTVSIAAFKVIFVVQVVAVNSDHVSNVVVGVADGPEADTVDAWYLDLEVRVVDVKVVARGVEFNTVKLHCSPARVHVASHAADPQDGLFVAFLREVGGQLVELGD